MNLWEHPEENSCIIIEPMKSQKSLNYCILKHCYLKAFLVSTNNIILFDF